MWYENTMIWKKPWKILKILWNILYENNGNIFCRLQENTANKNSSIRRTGQKQLMAVSNCAIFDKKKSKFIKSQQASRLELH